MNDALAILVNSIGYGKLTREEHEINILSDSGDSDDD